MNEPIPVVPLQYATPDTTGGAHRAKIIRIFALSAWIAACISTLLIFLEVETVMFTGPALFLLGTGILIPSFSRKDGLGIAVGAVYLVICLLFFGLVRLFHWSPGDSELPFRIMAPLFCVIMALPTSKLLHGMTRR